MQIQQKNMELKNRIRSIFKVAFPLIIQGLVFQLQSLTDKAFLGNLDTRFVSAIGAGQMPLNTTFEALVAISTGLVIIVSHLYGAKKQDEMAKYVKSAAFYTSLAAIGVFFLWQCRAGAILSFFQIDASVIGYSVEYVKICSFYFLMLGLDTALQGMLQGIGETKPIMYASIIKVFLNIFLSWVLIFGKFGFTPMYVKGAAIGTIAANVIAFLFIVGYCLLNRSKYSLIIFDTQWFSIKPYKEVIKLGVPVGLEYLLWNSSNLVLIRFINGFSYLYMAIYTLSFGFQCIVYVIFEGTSRATLSLMGQCFGAKEPQKADRYFFTSIGVNFIIVLIAVIVFCCIPGPLLSIFSNDPEVIQKGIPYLIFIGFIMIPQSMNVICGNGIKANDDTKWMLFSQIMGSILVISISCTLILVFHMDMRAVYLTLFLDETVRGGINFLYYRKKYAYKEGKEIHGSV